MRRWLGIALLMFSTSLHASEAALKETLVRIIDQLNATLPLLEEAKSEVNTQARIQLHIDAFDGADGQRHAGVRDDVLSIRNALIAYLNQPAIEPKTIKPLAFDFVSEGR